jgi:hypothetical protein
MTTGLSAPPSGPGQAPDPLPKVGKTGPGHLIARFVVGLFAVLGAVGSVITIASYLSPDSDEQRIIDVAADYPLAYRSRTFPMGVTVAGVDAGNEDLVQTEVTFWRDGGKPITPEMTRRPLRVILPSGSHLLAYTVVRTESSVPDNFTVERGGDDLSIRWKVFDPDMALKVAIVRSGSPASVLVSSEVGPGVVVNGSRYGAVKGLGLGTFFILVTLVLFTTFFALVGLFLVMSSKWDKRIPYASVRNVVAISTIIGLVALLHQGSKYDAQVVSWLASRIVRPIPFQ